MNPCCFKSSAAATGVALVLAGLSACATMTPSATLDGARRNYQTARADPQVAKFAPAELKQAADALARAEGAAGNLEKPQMVDHLAYLAKQQTALAEATARLRAAEQEISEAGAARERLRLAARTVEAERAQAEAAAAKQAAAASSKEAEQAKQQAQAAATVAEQEKAKREAMSEEERERLARMEEQLGELSTKQTERGLVVTLGDVLFDPSKARLSPRATRSLDRLADVLKEFSERKVLVEGFTDATGSEERNLELSEERAENVRRYLERKGVEGDRIETRGYGEDFPVASNETKSGRQANRRVEVVLSDEKGEITPR